MAEEQSSTLLEIDDLHTPHIAEKWLGQHTCAHWVASKDLRARLGNSAWELWRYFLSLRKCSGLWWDAVYPTKKHLQKHLGMSRSAVKRALRRLDEAGLTRRVGWIHKSHAPQLFSEGRKEGFVHVREVRGQHLGKAAEVSHLTLAWMRETPPKRRGRPLKKCGPQNPCTLSTCVLELNVRCSSNNERDANTGESRTGSVVTNEKFMSGNPFADPSPSTSSASPPRLAPTVASPCPPPAGVPSGVSPTAPVAHPGDDVDRWLATKPAPRYAPPGPPWDAPPPEPLCATLVRLQGESRGHRGRAAPAPLSAAHRAAQRLAQKRAQEARKAEDCVEPAVPFDPATDPDPLDELAVFNPSVPLPVFEGKPWSLPSGAWLPFSHDLGLEPVSHVMMPHAPGDGATMYERVDALWRAYRAAMRKYTGIAVEKPKKMAFSTKRMIADASVLLFKGGVKPHSWAADRVWWHLHNKKGYPSFTSCFHGKVMAGLGYHRRIQEEHLCRPVVDHPLNADLRWRLARVHAVVREKKPTTFEEFCVVVHSVMPEGYVEFMRKELAEAQKRQTSEEMHLILEGEWVW